MLINGVDFPRYTHKGIKTAVVKCWVCDTTFEVSTQEAEHECPSCHRLWRVLWDTVGFTPHLVVYAGDAHKDADDVSRFLSIVFKIEAFVESLKNDAPLCGGQFYDDDEGHSRHSFSPLFSNDGGPLAQGLELVIEALKADLEASTNRAERIRSRKG